LKEIDTWGEEAMSRVLGLVDSPNPQMLDAIMEYVVETELWPKRRVEPISLLQEYLQNGANLYIISAAYQPAVDIFARKISPERSVGIGTGVILSDGCLNLADQLNSRDRKISNLLAAIGSSPIEIALGDTFADIPLLEQAVKAIAVHPDRRLKNTAKERDWQIID
jgi:phosphoserine phosphatase